MTDEDRTGGNRANGNINNQNGLQIYILNPKIRGKEVRIKTGENKNR